MSPKGNVQVLIHWLCAASLGLGLGGCVASNADNESETHFLECATDSDCAEHGDEFACIEKRCQQRAPSTTEADDGASTDPVASDTARDTATDPPADSNTATEGPASPDAMAPECSGPGHYERGKGPSVPACCTGLNEVIQLARAEGEGGVRICTQGPGSVNFACVEGECGDGLCEVGEDVACGCVEDCPGAAWEGTEETLTDAPALVEDAGATTSEDVSIDASSSLAPDPTVLDGGSCGGFGAKCSSSEQCAGFGAEPALICNINRCLPPDTKACGGAAGWLCETRPFTICATLAGDAGACLDSAGAECVCDPGTSCMDHSIYLLDGGANTGN